MVSVAWLALLIVTANGAEVVLLWLSSAALMAGIEDVSVPETTCSLPLTIEQAVEVPASKDRAPVPEPPEVVIVARSEERRAGKERGMGRVAWLALLIVTANGAEVVLL